MDKDDDSHFCLRCRTTIQGLENYVAHRKSQACSTQLQGTETSPYLPQNQEDLDVLTQGHDRVTGSQFSTTAAEALASEAQFMESIGLYLNPKPSLQLARIPGLTSPRPGVSTSKNALTYQDDRETNRDDWDDGLVFGKSKPSPLPDLDAGTGSKSDFLRQIDLMTVDQTQSGQPGGTRWRLWNPEQEAGDDLWSDMLSSTEGDLYLETVANDPTLMEMSVAMASMASTTPTGNSQNIFKGRGKWLPTSDEVSLPEMTADESADHHFFCKTCSRKLSNNEAYLKHLSSELHFKRSAPLLMAPSGEGLRKRTSPDKVETPAIASSGPNIETVSSPKSLLPSGVGGQIITCETCQSKVNRGQFGKHLISHFHHHKSMGHPDNKQLALDYIEDIVLEAPYHCKICQFYCNWGHEFVNHWTGTHHMEHDKPSESFKTEIYWCSFCRFQSLSSDLMYDHLKGEDHCEISDVINRSVQMVIRKCQLEECSICKKLFRLKFSLKIHMRKAHGQKAFKLQDHEYFECRICGTYKTFSKRAITSHEFLAHPEARPRNSYECRFCCLQFNKKSEAERHRKTLQHRTKVKLSRGQTTEVTCQFCPEVLQNLKRLKDHIWSVHSKDVSQCGMCGLSFALPQELSVHVRSKCKDSSGGKQINDPQVETCFQFGCDFTCWSRTMMLVHQSLKHQTIQDSFSCILCNKTFKNRSKLSEHVRVHLKDEMQKCRECYKLFPSASLLQSHINRVHSMAAVNEPEIFCVHCDKSFTTRKSFSEHNRYFHNNKPTAKLRCSMCDFSTHKSSSLKSHLETHSLGKQLTCLICQKFTCKRHSELKRHKKLRHAEIKPDKVFKCSDCDYETVFKQHLERHRQGIHLNDTRYYCPACNYSSTAQDNLRKHILSTNKHKGMMVYNCKMENCSFSTNENPDYKTHLITSHADSFTSSAMVKSHLDDFFKKKVASKVQNKLEEKSQRRKQLFSQRSF